MTLAASRPECPAGGGRSAQTSSLMRKRVAALLLATGILAFLPLDAHAQRIPWSVLPLAASPVVAVILAAALGVVARSWSVGLTNAALVIVWAVWFVAAAKLSTSDLVIWASIVALGLHSLVMAWLIVLRTIRRVRVRNEA